VSDDREATIRRLFPLVKRIARRVQRMVAGSDIDDLIGDGCVGLIRAVDSYDASRGLTLDQYAPRIIAGSMLNGLRRLDPVSERVRRELREADRERFAIAAACGKLPSRTEMEQRRPALRRAMIHAYRHTPLSLDVPLPCGERLSGDWTADPALITGAGDERVGVRHALQLLPPRQQYVLTLHYYGGKSLHQIGEAMQISPQRASQLHQAALRNLRKAIHGAH
jgi:RNA polymerase sigma factor for flagellar operon FliA